MMKDLTKLLVLKVLAKAPITVPATETPTLMLEEVL